MKTMNLLTGLAPGLAKRAFKTAPILLSGSLKRGLCGLLLVPGLALAVPDAVFTVQAWKNQTLVRALTQEAACPGIRFDHHAEHPMQLRVAPQTLPSRPDQAKADAGPVEFKERVCEARWPKGAKTAQVAGQQVPSPPVHIHRIVLIGDTGCRMKAAEQAFQDCNDSVAWPFAQVALSAAALRPDLVVHVGDMHYRESPCPEGHAGCAGVAWGYGDAAWREDFFIPARPLLSAAPWVFVRGNHESCWRAGQGWFRFMDPWPWSAQRSCDDAANDPNADFSEPYAVALSPHAQLIVFDSSKTAGKPYAETDLAFQKYADALSQARQLMRKNPVNFFVSHHPLLALSSGWRAGKPAAAGNQGLQSVFEASFPQRLFPQGVQLTLAGHIHAFEAINFVSDHPTSLVLGNSGSGTDTTLPLSYPEGLSLYPGVQVGDYVASADFGFATLDRKSTGAKDAWLLTEYNTQGRPVFVCQVGQGKSHCAKAVPALE